MPTDRAEPAAGVVTVYTHGLWRSHAACSCGWTQVRPLLAWAVVDALLHGAETGHEAAWPLVQYVEHWRDLKTVAAQHSTRRAVA